MAADEGDNFFSRWSRRKVQERAGVALPPEAPATAPVAPAVPAATVVVSPLAAPAPAPAPAPAEAPEGDAAPPLPTLEDTQSLTPASDFSRFVAKGVSPEVRNAAVKKLFADPHFNVMDGLDIYIDDYSKPSPLSAADMAKMVSAQFLKLVEDPEDKKKKPLAAHPAAAPESVAEDAGADPLPATEDTRAPDAAEPEETPHDDHVDLQLQPDHAPGPQGPGPGAG